MKKELLRWEHIYVKKAGRQVLNDFSMNIYEDEFLFLYGFSDSGSREIGEILTGTRKLESGKIIIDGRNASTSSYGNPGEVGFYVIQNKNNLVENFTIAENLFFGGKKKYFQTVVPAKKQEIMAKRLTEEFGFEIDVRKKARNLTYFDEIMIKIIMAYARGARLVIFNDIQSLDGFYEENKLLKNALKKLRDDGISILWINQKMNDIQSMADRIVILEDGRKTRTLYKGSTPQSEEIKNEFLRKLTDKIEYETRLVTKKRAFSDNSKIVFKMNKISSKYLEDVSFEIHKGEMISISSKDNLKLHEFRNIILGEMHEYTGSMTMYEKEYRPADYLAAAKEGIGFLDMMWYESHCIPDMKVADNILIDSDWKRCRLFGIINNDKRKHMMNLYKMQHPGWPTDYFGSLSADQQKIVLLEKLIYEPYRLTIIIQPFAQLHGLMKGVFYNTLEEIKKASGAVILLSMGDPQCVEISDTSIVL
jgi:ribose transport system ATP-binding protein